MYRCFAALLLLVIIGVVGVRVFSGSAHADARVLYGSVPPLISNGWPEEPDTFAVRTSDAERALDALFSAIGRFAAARDTTIAAMDRNLKRLRMCRRGSACNRYVTLPPLVRRVAWTVHDWSCAGIVTR